LVHRADIELPRLGRGQFVAAIRDALSSNVDASQENTWQQEPNRGALDRKWEEEAIRRARMSGRSITVYRRFFASAGAAPLPAWATFDKADQLIPIVLADSWSEENDADRLAMAKLAGCDYAAIIEPKAWVFASENRETPLWRDNLLRRHVRPALEKVGLGWVDFKVMRRTNASLGHGAKVDPKVSADQRGHGIGVSLDVYTSSSMGQKAVAAKKLEDSVLGRKVVRMPKRKAS
jgi:hypothetical protein